MHNSNTPPSRVTKTGTLRCSVCALNTENPNPRYTVPLVFEGAFSVAAISLVGVSV